ncbi:MAG: tail-specific protease precursor [Mucilaginibacter sp.]|nr:tail-specific protease precursor [Mucilaginibacter sp.]
MNRLMMVLLLTGAVLRSAAQDGSNAPAQDELVKQSKLLVQVGSMLESRHYSPRAIDDNFSKAVWERYINKLDLKKEIFLKGDIDLLKKYQLSIDDEINGTKPIVFLPYVLQLYSKRLDECMLEYRQILSTPFNFNKKEKGLPVVESKMFPVNENERRELGRKRLKYMTLQAFAKLQEQRAADKLGGPVYGLSDATLEKLARETTGKNIELQVKRLKSGLDEEKQFAVFAGIIVRYMDPHSDYLPPADTRGYQESVSNRFFGTGARVLEKDGVVYINDMEPGSPAQKSGQVEIGDVIAGVGEGVAGDIIDVTGMSAVELTKLIRGNKGTIVRLSLKKADGTSKIVPITRGEIIPEDGRVRIALVKHGEKKTGYILLPGFYDDTNDPNGPHCAKDVAAALETFKKEKVDGIIIDLRTNGGGSFREAVSMVKMFVKSGPIVQTKDRNENPVAADAPQTKQIYQGPLVVMVNELSASASEIFSAAIQDDHRGVIIGSASTYGKGSSQGAFAVGGSTQNGILKITMEKFYRLNGGATQLQGVKSDIILPDIYGYQKIREKDNADALPWDTIAPAIYTVENLFDLQKIKNLAAARLRSDTVFTKLAQNITWLGNNRDADLPLELASYKALDAARQKISKENESLLKLKSGKEMMLLAPAGIDATQNVHYQQLLTKLSTDIYLDQAVKVITDLSSLNTVSP